VITEVWLKRYGDDEWSVKQRGPFSFDYCAWVRKRIDLEKSEVAAVASIRSKVPTSVRMIASGTLAYFDVAWLGGTAT